MKILNTRELSTNQLRKKALAIAEAGLKAIDTALVIRNSLILLGNTIHVREKTFELQKDSRVLVVAVGKCAIDAAWEVEKILGDWVTSGIVLDVRENKTHLFKKIECIVGSHPMPTATNVEATKKIVKSLASLSPHDLVLFVISGGGSTLLCLPGEDGSFSEEARILGELFRAGAPIQDINIIRKHLSLARGGYLAQYAFPARVLSLIFSDVPGNEIGFIASGPTTMDSTTIGDAETLLLKYKILPKSGAKNYNLVETPKDDKFFTNVYNCIVAFNNEALEAMADEAKKQGLTSVIKETNLTGEAILVGRRIAQEIAQVPAGSAHLFGGETTVVIGGGGRGGRNQELALASLENILPNTLVLSLASDGKDNGPYAGAIADQEILSEAKKSELHPENFLQENNSSEFFEKTGGVIMTGDTGSNVSDLIIAIKNN